MNKPHTFKNNYCEKCGVHEAYAEEYPCFGEPMIIGEKVECMIVGYHDQSGGLIAIPTDQETHQKAIRQCSAYLFHKMQNKLHLPPTNDE